MMADKRADRTKILISKELVESPRITGISKPITPHFFIDSYITPSIIGLHQYEYFYIRKFYF